MKPTLRRTVEQSINDFIAEKTYPIILKTWDVIAILRDDDVFDKIYEYSKKTGEMDFRLKLNYAKFKNASPLEREKMIFEMLLRSLSILKEKGVSGIGMETLLSDVSRIGQAAGWV